MKTITKLRNESLVVYVDSNKPLVGICPQCAKEKNCIHRGALINLCNKFSMDIVLWECENYEQK